MAEDSYSGRSWSPSNFSFESLSIVVTKDVFQSISLKLLVDYSLYVRHQEHL